MPTNRSLWQDSPGLPGIIRESPIPSLDEDKVLVKVHAWAMNPCDALLQDTALPFVKYPVILGQDVAGIVEKAGSKASNHFQPADRVFGLTINNGFQDFVTIDHRLMAKIPDTMSFREACVFPLCVTTSAFSLFGADYLNLQHPTLHQEPSPRQETVLVWGASSAAGSNAIQLLKAAGYDVAATCSPKNFNYVKELGASSVFDYNSPTVVDDVVAQLDQGRCAGIYMAAGKVGQACEVSHRSKQKVRELCIQLLSLIFTLIRSFSDFQRLFVASSNPIMPGDAPEGVEAKFTFGTGGVEAFVEILPITFGGFLPEALNKGVYKVAPPPKVVSIKGLDAVQEALDLLKNGVSGEKLVVEKA